jgi:hypothetical protein
MKLPFCNFNFKSNEIFELVHSDVWGPALVTSYNDFRYYIIFIDDFSKNTWLYLLKNKSEVFTHFQTFTNLVETQYNKKLKSLQRIMKWNLLTKISPMLQTRGVSSMKPLVFTHLNKMRYPKEKIVTYSK